MSACIREISSQANPLIKRLARLKNKKYRSLEGAYLVEGARACSEALSSKHSILAAVMTRGFFDVSGSRYQELPCYLVPDALFAQLAETETPQGILLAVKIPPQPSHFDAPLYLYCDGLKDPGNAGTIIRTADAFGFGGVWFSQDSVDIYNGKTVRSAMGSLFHVELVSGLDPAFLQARKQEGYRLVSSALSDTALSLPELQLGSKTILAVGNEAHGISSEVLAMSDTIVKIPMQGSAESLNAGVAAAILMYEAVQSTKGGNPQ